jgi:hypothetical protein
MKTRNSRRVAAALAAAAATVAALLLAGCSSGSSSTVSQPAPAASSSPTVNPVLKCGASGGTWNGTSCDMPGTPSTDPNTEDPAVGAIGTSMAVTGSNGNVYEITAQKVIDPAAPASQYDTPDNGKHFAGVVFKVTVNYGTLNDNAVNCATLLGNNGSAYEATVSSIAGYGGTTTALRLNAGESQTVAVVFQVPNGVRPATVKWTPDSGSLASTATWTVG